MRSRVLRQCRVTAAVVTLSTAAAPPYTGRSTHRDIRAGTPTTRPASTTSSQPTTNKSASPSSTSKSKTSSESKFLYALHKCTERVSCDFFDTSCRRGNSWTVITDTFYFEFIIRAVLYCMLLRSSCSYGRSTRLSKAVICQ